MNISFSCPECHHRLRAPVHTVGKQASCPHCGRQLLVPESSQPETAGPPETADAAQSQGPPATAENPAAAAPIEPAPPAVSTPPSAPTAPASNAVAPVSPNDGIPAPAPLPRASSVPTPLKAPAARSWTLNVEPVLPRTSDNAVSKAELVRDQIYRDLETAFREGGVQAQILKSPPFSGAVWLKCECWIPRGAARELTRRTSAKIEIVHKEYHTYSHELTITLQVRRTPKRFFSVVKFQPQDARALVACLLEQQPLKSLRFEQCRLFPLDFSKPKNKLERLQRDFWLRVIVGLTIVGVATLAIVIGVVFLLAAVGLAIWRYQQKVYALSSGRPPQEPRSLIGLDSWQTLVHGSGKRHLDIKRRLLNELAKASGAGFSVADEKIDYLGPDGKQEREQTVVSFRRGIGFIQVTPYGDDLYVAWDTHVNAGTWRDQPTLVTGVDAVSGEQCRWHAIEAAWHIPNEYDVSDASCLTEWIHGAATKVVREALAENRVDQEIDFKIIRSQRSGIVGRDKPEEAESGGLAGRIRSAFSSSRLQREK